MLVKLKEEYLLCSKVENTCIVHLNEDIMCSKEENTCFVKLKEEYILCSKVENMYCLLLH